MLLVASGCGSQRPSGAERATWIASADAICARYGPRLAALPATSVPAHLAAVLALALPEIEEVARLPVPAGDDGAAIHAVVTAREDALAALTTAAGEALHGADPTATLQRERVLADHASALATALGMHVCGRAPQGASNSS
jgi:hypothetical protein